MSSAFYTKYWVLYRICPILHLQKNILLFKRINKMFSLKTSSLLNKLSPISSEILKPWRFFLNKVLVLPSFKQTNKQTLRHISMYIHGVNKWRYRQSAVLLRAIKLLRSCVLLHRQLRMTLQIIICVGKNIEWIISYIISIVFIWWNLKYIFPLQLDFFVMFVNPRKNEISEDN